MIGPGQERGFSDQGTGHQAMLIWGVLYSIGHHGFFPSQMSKTKTKKTKLRGWRDSSALAAHAHAKEQGSVPSTYVVAHNIL